jgi:leucyl-tRNA---protein transferase
MLNQAFECQLVSASELDQILAQGWRHFGTYFFRYSSLRWATQVLHVQPLRMRLENFIPNRSQKRIWQRNQDLITTVETARVLPEYKALFDLHKVRFFENIPDQLEDYLGDRPERFPCDTRVIRVLLDNELVAAHFIDIGEHSLSSVYSVYNPKYGGRSLGIFTILKAIKYAQDLGKRWYYLGFATREPSHYDYKKQFAALEFFNWQTWQPLELEARS